MRSCPRDTLAAARRCPRMDSRAVSAARSTSRLASLVLLTQLFVHGAAPVAAQTEGRAAAAGQLTWGINVALAPTWFDPAESTGLLTAFIFYYALHDALVKPMPGKPMAPSLAESWSVSADG